MCNDCSGHPMALGAIDNVFGTNGDLPWRPHTQKTVVLVTIACLPVFELSFASDQSQHSPESL